MISDLSHARVFRTRDKELRRGSGGNIRTIGGGTTTVALTTTVVLESVQIPLLLRTVEFIEAWEEWIEHRLECGRQYRWPTTIRCFKRTMIDCEKWGAERAVTAIHFCVSRCYRGLFEPRKFYVQQSKPKHVNGTVHTGVQGRIY